MMKKYLYILMTAVLSMALVSCVEEEPYAPGELDNEDCYGVYFPTQKGVGDLQIEPEDPTTLTFIARRTNTRGEIHVPVKVKSNYPIFTVDEVVFEDGSPVADVVVHFPSAKIATTYDCTLMLTGDEFVSKYSANPSHLDFSVTRVKWNDVIGPNGETTGRWRDGIFPEWFSVSSPNLERSVTIQERDDKPGYYRIWDVYSADYLSDMFGSNMAPFCLSQHYTYIDATNPDKVWIPTFQTGLLLSAEYGMTSIGSYVVENSNDFDASIASVYGTLRDGVITFPYGSLQMKLELYGWYSSNSAGLHRIILPGYRAKDYEMSVSAGVSDKYGNLPVNVSFGSDISQVRLAVFEGTLTESAAAQKAQLLVDNPDAVDLGEVVTVTSASAVDYSFEKTGMYTVVAAGFDIAGTYRVMSHSTFGYLQKGDDSNEVILSYGLICSDKYASEGMTSKNSMEIYISGKDIQRLHAGFYTKEQWEENQDKIKAELVNSQMTKASLDQINGSGLFLKQGYLVPGTDYVLVIKAYNGYREQFFVAHQKTGGDWDPRLAEYDLSDVDMNLIPADQTGYFGKYHYYALEGDMYSRAYLGDVTISQTFPSDYTPNSDFAGYTLVNIKGLFPLARTFGLEDDSYSFIYYDNVLYNVEQAFESFYSEGALFYPAAYMYSEGGSAFGGRMGLMGAFVQDGYISIMDSGMFASYGEHIDGFAVIAYQDPNHTTYSGVIDIVSSMLLVREDLDPNPIIDERREEKNNASKAQVKSYFSAYSETLRRGPQNCVETFETYLMKAIKNSRSQVRIKNYLDVNNLQTVESIEMKPAAHKATVR